MNQKSDFDAKEAAVEQWTADPCGSVVHGDPGTRSYFEDLMAARREYAPWTEKVLGYRDTAGLDVLDLGCGQGIDLAEYARAGAEVTGIDLTPRHAELAASHLAAMRLKATILSGDGEQLPFADNSFDRVSSNGVLHHTPDMPAALREIRRVLRLGGETRIIVYNRSSLHYWLNQVLWVGLIKGHLFRERSMAGVLSSGVERSSTGARPLVNVYSPDEVRRMLIDIGFADVRVEVRHFNRHDAFPYKIASDYIKALQKPELLDRIGRRAGWYVIGRGICP